jgi:hypothetical protein
VLDLGSELEDFDDDRGPLWRAMEAQDVPTIGDVEFERPVSSGHIVPLADLEREGFNTTPPPGYELAKDMKATRDAIDDVLFKGLAEALADADLTITTRLWTPEEADALDDAAGSWPGDGFEPTGMMGGDDDA